MQPRGLTQIHPRFYGPAKILPLASALVSNGTDDDAKLAVIEWLLKRGADPQRCHPSDNGCVAEVRKKHDRENTLLQIPYAGHSAISFAFAQLQAMRKAIGVDWSVRIRYFEKALELLGTIKAVNEENVAVPRSLVDMWESLREMTSTHNVVFETADDDVSAHELILLAASPVQKAMLESAMMEGSSKRIAVKDRGRRSLQTFGTSINP